MSAIRKPSVLSTNSKVLTKDEISTVLLTFDIKDWLSIFVELFRTTCKYEMPTRHYSNIRINTNDGKVLVGITTNRIEQILLKKDAPLGPVKYEISHKSLSGIPKNIPTNFGRPTNIGNLLVIGPNKQITITADVIEETYNLNKKSHHIYGHNFSRNLTTQTDESGKPFDKCESIMLEYNEGTIEFITVDDYSPQELLDHFKLIMQNFSKGIRDNWAARFQFLLGRGELTMPTSFASKYAELLFEVMAINYPKIRQSKTVKNSDTTIMSFANATRQEITQAIQESLTTIDEMFW